MKAIAKTLAACLLLILLILPGCQRRETPKSKTALFRLFDLFQPEDLAGTVTPENAGWKRVEWGVTNMSPWRPPVKTDDAASSPTAPAAPAIGFRALND